VLPQDLVEAARLRERVLKAARQEHHQDLRRLFAGPKERVRDPARKKHECAGLRMESLIAPDEVDGPGEDVEGLVLVAMNV
jgi:hypothetical protein